MFNEKIKSYFMLFPDINPIEDKIYEFKNIVEKALGIEIVDLFVNNRIGSNDIPQFESLWFFSDDYAIECKQFLTQTNFDYSKREDMFRLEFTVDHFNFENYSSRSRLKIDGVDKYRFQYMFIASGSNCKKLFDVYKEFYSGVI